MINEELKQKATDYFNSIPELEGQVPSELLIDFVIEKYKEHRSYPPSFNDEKIENEYYEWLKNEKREGLSTSVYE